MSEFKSWEEVSESLKAGEALWHPSGPEYFIESLLVSNNDCGCCEYPFAEVSDVVAFLIERGISVENIERW